MAIKCCTDKESAQELARTVEFLKIISEANRLRILCLLKGGEKCVCEIWRFLDLPQNLASHHLKVLKDFGLLSARKDGLNIYYSIDQQTLDDYSKLLDRFLNS